MRIIFFSVLALFSCQAFSESTISDHREKEIHCLALNIYFEARGEAPEGQLAVAMVSMNRVKSHRFPSSVCRVVWQPRQFSWTHDGKSDRPTDKGAWRKALKMASSVYQNYWGLPDHARAALDITRGALHYYAPDLAKPYWARAQEVTRAIGRHIFLRKRS